MVFLITLLTDDIQKAINYSGIFLSSASQSVANFEKLVCFVLLIENSLFVMLFFQALLSHWALICFPRPLFPIRLPDRGLRLLCLPRGAGDQGQDAGRDAAVLSRRR